MRKLSRLAVLGLCWTALACASTTVTVSVSTPTNGATVPSPVVVKATATASYGKTVTGWAIYADGNTAWRTAGPTSSISASFPLAVGGHTLVIRAWDSSGHYGSVTRMITVAAPSSVTVTAPLAGTAVSSPVTVQAAATSPNGISGWVIYANSQNVYQVDNYSNALSAMVTLAPGTYSAYIRAWDRAGAGFATSATFSFTVKAPAPPPNPYVVPPLTALIFSQEQNNPLAYWRATSAEAGGQVTTDFTTTANVASPSLSGASREFHISGGPWVAALWYHRLNLTAAQSDAFTHFLVDYDFYVDPLSQGDIHTLEYDTMQVVGGHEYMIGSHCNFGDGYWSAWNQAMIAWVNLPNVPCNTSLTPPGAWHHVQWHMERLAGTTSYRYDTLIVDGVVYTINLVEPASASNWSDNITVQWQIDTNGLGGTANQWIDNVRVSLW